MDVAIKPELERFVAEKVEAGQFATPSELINEALEAYKDQEDYSAEQKEHVRRELQRGLEQLDRGEGRRLDIKNFIAEERQRLAKKGAN